MVSYEYTFYYCRVEYLQVFSITVTMSEKLQYPVIIVDLHSVNQFDY